MTINKKNASRDRTLNVGLSIAQVTQAMSDLHVQARLEFAQNLLFSNGGNKDALEPNAVLILVHDVIGEVVDVLERHPRVAKLRTPEHKPG